VLSGLPKTCAHTSDESFTKYAYFWDRAKAELTQLYKEGSLPINQPSGREVLEEER
jgi:hypothetical protein